MYRLNAVIENGVGNGDFIYIIDTVTQSRITVDMTKQIRLVIFGHAYQPNNEMNFEINIYLLSYIYM